MKTFSAKPLNINKKWVIIDAKGLVLGRLASIIAYRLRGKHLPIFTPHMDIGDNIIVININKIILTGNKRTNKTYYWHTGYPGGIKSCTAEDILNGQFPTNILKYAVKRMLPGGPLSRKQMKNLYLYSNIEYKQKSQNPEILNIVNTNSKKYKNKIINNA